MYRQMKWDQDKVPKRIGEGFYEQQLLADQILKQTGKRHLDGYTDDETAFKALMDAGISYAKEMNIAPGVTLSKEQVAALTSDMVWLEERDVYVNGKKERAVYPVLYTKNTNGLRLTAGGSLISAKNIAIETKDALKNAGTLYGENILAQAGDIENTGLIRGQKIGLKSERDIRVQGSVIGDKAVVLEAANNIDVSSTTERLAHQDVLNTTAGIAVKGDEGVLVVSAGKNAALAGATLEALGKNGSVLLSAGENISLDTKKLQSDKDMTADAANYLRTKRGTELGTEIQADGNISIAAGNDLTARAAEISSKNGATSLSAGNDISLTAGRETSEDHYGIRYKESGLLSSKTTTIRIDTESDIARTTNITGQHVNITAKRDATFAAANIAADNDVNIAAGRNFSAVSAENYSHTENYKEVKKSGIFGSGGGLGFTIGTQQTKTTRDSDAITQQGTNIAALGGNVSISAGENAHISSSAILADKDATVTAKQTLVDGKDNVYRESIDIRENPTQDISALSRDTANSLNELGKIFDKAKIEERQELAAVFGEEAFRLLHNMKDDGSGRKIAAHAIIGGLMSQITGAGFASGAIGAGLNEALIKALDGKDPGTAQIISAIIGAAAAKVAGGNALAGASAAASGTKWNYFLMSRPKEFGISELAKNILRKKDGRELSEEEVDAFLRESNNILSDMEPDLGLDKENPFAEDINNYQKVIRYLEIHGVAKDSAMRFFTTYNETVRNRDWTGVYNKPGSIDVIWDSKKNNLVDVRPPIPVYNPFDTRTYQEGQIIGGEASSDQSKAAFGKTVGIETFKAEVDRPVTLYNKYANNPVKALKFGVFAPLGLGYDIYQDYGKYSGTDLTKVTLVNGGAFVATSIADAWLIGSAGMSVEATIPANIVIVEFANELKKSLAKTDEEKQRENP